MRDFLDWAEKAHVTRFLLRVTMIFMDKEMVGVSVNLIKPTGTYISLDLSFFNICISVDLQYNTLT